MNLTGLKFNPLFLTPPTSFNMSPEVRLTKLQSYIFANYVVPLFIHMVSAIFCLGCSALYHQFKDSNEVVNKTLARLDYAGISILIAGSNTVPLYYILFCEPMHCK
jgi:predicted membrane channel-forming protein YqfA (hemolysin III family)